MKHIIANIQRSVVSDWSMKKASKALLDNDQNTTKIYCTSNFIVDSRKMEGGVGCGGVRSTQVLYMVVMGLSTIVHL